MTGKHKPVLPDDPAVGIELRCRLSRLAQGQPAQQAQPDPAQVRRRACAVCLPRDRALAVEVHRVDASRLPRANRSLPAASASRGALPSRTRSPANSATARGGCPRPLLPNQFLIQRNRSDSKKNPTPTIVRVQSTVYIGKRHRVINKDTFTTSMAKSMKALGCQHPISVFRKDGAVHLSTGHRRVEAAKQLGWEHINGIFVDELSELNREVWEIEENLMRDELSAAEERAHFKRRKEIWKQQEAEVSGQNDPKPKSWWKRRSP